MIRGKIEAVCMSSSKGQKKRDVGKGFLRDDFGLVGDAHAGGGHRQLSLLAIESIDKMRAAGLKVGAGDFAENLTTRGIDLCALPIGTVLKVGETALLEITQIGKECHNRCAIYHEAGDCVMPKEGIFARIIRSGSVATGDVVEALSVPPASPLLKQLDASPKSAS